MYMCVGEREEGGKGGLGARVCVRVYTHFLFFIFLYFSYAHTHTYIYTYVINTPTRPKVGSTKRSD